VQVDGALLGDEMVDVGVHLVLLNGVGDRQSPRSPCRVTPPSHWLTPASRDSLSICYSEA
jgi:hypothetical protein